MTFSIITPSFKQLDWLRLCVASVRDQVGAESSDESRASSASNPSPLDSRLSTPSSIPRHPTIASRPLCVEHIIQDAGTPGIEDFAREIGADFYRDGRPVFQTVASNEWRVAGGGSEMANGAAREGASPVSLHPLPATRPYRIAIYSERDAGMYDAVNRGIRRSGGEFVAYLNCDEQYLPGTLRRVVEFFDKNPAVEVLFMDAIVVDSDGKYLCDRRVMVPGRLHTLVSGNLSIFTAATFSRRSVFSVKGLFYDPKWKDVGDADWAIRLSESALRMAAYNKAASAFVDTGENMNIRPNAIREKSQLFESAPSLAKHLKSIILLGYRLGRLIKGLYFLKPHSYQIYTRSSPEKRVMFHVEKPTFQWRGR